MPLDDTCEICAAHGRSYDECRELMQKDVDLLNESQIHIASRHNTFSRETIHAFAEIIRCLNREFAVRDAAGDRPPSRY